ncbi:MAG: sulfurtransferase complex subunit TusD [Halioglobus sp.]
MIYSLLVLSSPSSGHSAASAVAFAEALLRSGHTLKRVFFMDEGVHAGSSHRVIPQDESDTMTVWRNIASSHNVDLVLCVSSAIKRGIIDSTEADRYDKPGSTVHGEFAISGLGQLVGAAVDSDRLITFGG